MSVQGCQSRGTPTIYGELTFMPHPVISFAEQALGCALRVEGDIGLLERPRRALLISRGQRGSTPADPRIRATIEATQRIVEARETLVVGADRQPWDLALWTCRQGGGNAIVAASDRNARNEILPESALLVWPDKNAQPGEKIERLRQRDRLAGLLASSAYAIQLRSGGNMAMIADELAVRGRSVDAWRLETYRCAEPTAPAVESVAHMPVLVPGDRLTHFTREPELLWPDERYVDYLQWLASGPGFTPRDGYQSLRRILAQKKIKGCGRLINGGEPMVCLTARNPIELLEENRWRKGLHRWTYSSYGLSFERADLEAMGARPVRYTGADAFKECSASARGFLQIESSGGIDWRAEAEWRVWNELDFSRLDPKRIVTFVATESEGRVVEREFGTRSLFVRSKG